MPKLCPHCGKSLDELPEFVSFSEAEIERFWATIDKTETCWISRTNPSGTYGRLQMAGKQRLAHVVAWIITYGQIPPGKKVCHNCDQPKCARPDHLFLGTHAENMRDMVRKGRNKPRFGLSNNLAKLTDAQVIEIKRALASGAKTTRELATENKVTFQSIWRIKKGLARAHILL